MPAALSGDLGLAVTCGTHVSTSTEKKSVAAIAPHCPSRNAAHDPRFVRSGAGTIPASDRIA
jgi:hypothetical protein